MSYPFICERKLGVLVEFHQVILQANESPTAESAAHDGPYARGRAVHHRLNGLPTTFVDRRGDPQGRRVNPVFCYRILQTGG
jgi:hypothetical protein